MSNPVVLNQNNSADPKVLAESPLVVDASNLSKTYIDGKLKVTVLQSVSLQIKTGDSVAIVGTSGSGKSTLLHLLGGLDTPTTGEVFIAGRNINKLSETARGDWRNKTLGFVYQFHHLLPEFTALENVAMPLLIRRMEVDQARDLALQMLAKVGLGHRAEHKPAELSGGERQRTALARALVTKPLCLLADEPTGNLDRKTADAVFDLLLTLNHELGTSIIIVTHDERIAQRMGRTMLLDDGKINVI